MSAGEDELPPLDVVEGERFHAKPRRSRHRGLRDSLSTKRRRYEWSFAVLLFSNTATAKTYESMYHCAIFSSTAVTVAARSSGGPSFAARPYGYPTHRDPSDKFGRPGDVVRLPRFDDSIFSPGVVERQRRRRTGPL